MIGGIKTFPGALIRIGESVAAAITATRVVARKIEPAAVRELKISQLVEQSPRPIWRKYRQVNGCGIVEILPEVHRPSNPEGDRQRSKPVDPLPDPGVRVRDPLPDYMGEGGRMPSLPEVFRSPPITSGPRTSRIC